MGLTTKSKEIKPFITEPLMKLETMQLLQSFIYNADTHRAHPNLPQQNIMHWDFPPIAIVHSSYPHIREKKSQENK
jgi:hypothetical protein